MANWCQMVKHLTGGCLLALTATSELSHSPTSGKTTSFGVKDWEEKPRAISTKTAASRINSPWPHERGTHQIGDAVHGLLAACDGRSAVVLGWRCKRSRERDPPTGPTRTVSALRLCTLGPRWVD
ncbi:efflux pump antibiotic resistance protein [Aspergillus luchuensis]|uniref:Efflux pump antibiotic resistance protein n=1 Tax=Aspergillus kawachii TaxID=1069201 RepID=A0A146EYS7_ASPKA|nr:efflux pump antibiotic resistance protein [Aspergillus luchuensis]